MFTGKDDNYSLYSGFPEKERRAARQDSAEQQQVKNMFKKAIYLDTMETKENRRKSNVLEANMNLNKYLLSRNYKDGI